MKNLNPTSPPRQAILSGLVREDLHNSIYRKLAARADLEPGSQQLLAGGIGSGKTTQLLLAETWLRTEESTLPLYIDIAAETDLSGLNSGALLAAFGLHLVQTLHRKKLQPLAELKEAEQSVKVFSLGKTETRWVDDDYFEEPESPGRFETHCVPGKLQPPFPAFQRDIQEILGSLEVLLAAMQTTFPDVVVIFDGLDRLVAPDRFWALAEQDFRALRGLGASVLAAAPVSVLYGTGRQVAEHFDRVHHLQTLPAEPGKGEALRSVLEHRGGLEMLGSQQAERICCASGGVLRDLITLARDAGEEAYVSGSDGIRVEDVEKAVGQLGASYLRGLGSGQLKALSALQKTRSFDLASSTNMELLVTRRVLEYSATDFRVHPALLELIAQPEARIA